MSTLVSKHWAFQVDNRSAGPVTLLFVVFGFEPLSPFLFVLALSEYVFLGGGIHFLLAF